MLPAAMDAWGHDIARRRGAGIEALLRQPFADDVAVGHQADQLVVLSNRNERLYHAYALILRDSVTGVSGPTQSTPLCIASLTFMSGLRC